MDYLDPRQQFRHKILLTIGYVFITIAIVVTAIVLKYQADGFGVTENGTVIQNGLVFFSSQPNPARIYIDGKLNSKQTNTRKTLQAGAYKVTIAKTGYRDWKRTIEVDGGSVTHFDYPLLFPTKLVSTPLQTFDAEPSFTTQSNDRHWLLVSDDINHDNFSLYDLTAPTKAPDNVDLPTNVVTPPTSEPNNQHWQVVSWADDNQHVLLQHFYDNTSEYILVDRAHPEQSLNLTQTLGTNPSQLTFNNNKYDQYYLYDEATHILQTASLKAPQPVTYINEALAFKTYSDNTVLYMTAADQPAGKVELKMKVGDQNYLLHSFPVDPNGNYLLDLTQYDGVLYVVASSASDNKVYIYKDPLSQLADNATTVATDGNTKSVTEVVSPVQVLKVTDPNYIKFSVNTQFILAEHGSQASVYDIETKNTYNYKFKAPLDSPQTHVSWMDGDRLTYVSNGKLQVVDYDNKNAQTLVAAYADQLPDFSPDYTNLYTLAPDSEFTNVNQAALNQTALVTK